jgi:alpha-beta hydrolase superfamily lysophospholipase
MMRRSRRPRLAWSIAELLTAAALVYALGPRAQPDIRIAPAVLPADLDTWLAQSEARYTDLRPDAGKRIVWADPATKARTRFAIVYIHGFSATRVETNPLTEKVAAALGANVFYTRLTGHGRSEDAMGEATLSAWMNDALEAYAVGQRLGDRIVVMGTSTGGGLATLLAANQAPKDLHALVLISPNFAVRQWNAPIILWPWGEQIARLVVGEYRTWDPVNPRQAEHWTMRYPVRALVPMMQSVAMLDALDLGRLRTPTLLFYAHGDRLVDTSVVERRFAQIGAARKALVAVDYAEDPMQHVLAGDIVSPGATERVAATVVEFVRVAEDGAAHRR